MNDRTWKRKFASFEEAKAYLEERGKLEFFGRAGRDCEYCVYRFTHSDTRVYSANVYNSGLLVVREMWGR